MAVMGIEPNQLVEYVIRPTLISLDLYSLSAVKLLLGTCAQESRLGHFLHQVGGGPAVGIYQMEPATHIDIWENYLKYNSALRRRVIAVCGARSADLDVMMNLGYATALARIHYLRVPEPLPNSDDLEGMAKYWKTYYNTVEGKGSCKEFVQNYEHLVPPSL